MNRRRFLKVSSGAAIGVVLSGCADDVPGASGTPSAGPTATRSAALNGPVRRVELIAEPTTVDLGGLRVPTWAYGGELPGREIRVRKGEILEAVLRNRLPGETSVHWHGIALPNAMDGVPGVTQDPIAAGSEFTYRFSADISGTYWFHPHTGLQLERGLYAPLIIEDPDDGDSYDEEWVIVLDDWLDGVDGTTPEDVFAEIRGGMGGMDHSGMDMGGMDMQGMDHGSMDMNGMQMGSPSPSPSPSGTGGAAAGMLMGARSLALGGDAGDVSYPHYLINGRMAADPQVLTGRPGQRVRIRLINAGGDTAFRVALADHRMTVTHTDGFAVEPVTVDTVLLGMGERYDVEVTLGDGAFPLVALAEGKNRSAQAIVRTSTVTATPAPDARPAELDGELLSYDQLTPAEGLELPERDIDREHRFELTGGMAAYDWTINGRRFGEAEPLPVEEGERVRLTFVNTTEMWHPMHLHGHTFQINTGGPRKDTVAVLPDQTVTCDFDADNAGEWMIHCHNAYHLEAGMMAALRYE